MSPLEENITRTRAWPQLLYVLTPAIVSNTNLCQNPPLYLRVTSTSKEGLDQAVKMIEEMLTQELPNLVDERRFRRREPENFERDEFGRVRFPGLHSARSTLLTQSLAQMARGEALRRPGAYQWLQLASASCRSWWRQCQIHSTGN